MHIWPHAHFGSGYYYLAYAERAADTPKIRALTDWILTGLTRDCPSPGTDNVGADGNAKGGREVKR